MDGHRPTEVRYTDLDKYDVAMAELLDDLKNIEISPIADTDLNRQQLADIEAIVKSSDNVFRFPPRKSDEDKEPH